MLLVEIGENDIRHERLPGRRTVIEPNFDMVEQCPRRHRLDSLGSPQQAGGGLRTERPDEDGMRVRFGYQLSITALFVGVVLSVGLALVF